MLNERDLHALRVFQVVASAGGFSAAEKRLCMTTATISRKIKDVEERIGLKLCTRGPQGFALTSAGKVALTRIQDAWDAVDRILPAIEFAAGVMSGQLKVAILHNVIGNPDCHLASAIEQFNEEAPDVEFFLRAISGTEITRYLSNHEFHIIISASPRDGQHFAYDYLFDEVQKVYYRPTHRPLDQLKMAYCPVTNILSDVVHGDGHSHNPIAEGLQSVAFMIATGQYKGMLPNYYVDQIAPDHDMAVFPGSETYTFPFYAITNTSRPLLPCAIRFIEILKTHHQANIEQTR